MGEVAPFFLRRIYWIETEKGRGSAVRCGNNLWFPGICALALGLGILITAIFPVGVLMFLIAFLLIVCGGACLRR